MSHRSIGPYESSAVAFGSMNICHVYYPLPDEASGLRLLNEALDEGYTMFDTAAIYGYGKNERMIAQGIMHRRSEFTLASKGAIYADSEGKSQTCGRPESLMQNCHDSLKRLNTEFIDVYYLHRFDQSIAIEEQVGALARLKDQGKIGAIGLSEVSAKTLRKGHAEHPIAAVQSEYSLWTRNPEIAVLDTCRELGTAFVAFSPTGRKYLTGTLTDMAQVPEGDLRYTMPRFDEQNYPANMQLLQPFLALAKEAGILPAELAIAWVLAQGEHIIALPGTSQTAHMRQNANADRLSIDPSIIERAGKLIHQGNVHGPRYNAITQAGVDTEEF
ncbi:MAG: aldo/keto reductase [Gammaproteobacteria bacterium]|jgi:hypothetical protein|nr:aldo/keto reductase [Gammaproteobacteria bacterium]MCP4880167.1 aldo/keto reductase [Gammaproteobacteria bacterium]MDP6166179.1 aldo/keto reductase [Gammaproteobacteria bacterium]